jgi:hypothetical protein
VQDRQVAVGGQGSGGAIKIVASRLTVIWVESQLSSSSKLVIRPWTALQWLSGESDLKAIRFGAVRDDVAFGCHLRASPGPLFLPGLARTALFHRRGIAVPASPTGSNDVTVPTATPNPVSITLATSGVPVGSTSSR